MARFKDRAGMQYAIMEKPGGYGNNENFKPSASRFFFKRDTQSTAKLLYNNTLQSIIIIYYIIYYM